MGLPTMTLDGNTARILKEKKALQDQKGMESVLSSVQQQIARAKPGPDMADTLNRVRSSATLTSSLLGRSSRQGSFLTKPVLGK